MSDDTTPSKVTGDQWIMLRYFAAKTAIVAIAVTISLSILVDRAISGIDEIIDGKMHQLEHLAGPENLHIGQALDRAIKVINDVSPGRKETLLNDVRILAEWIRPFILEAEAALSPAPAKATR